MHATASTAKKKEKKELQRENQCSAARTNVVFTNSYVDKNSSLVSE
jgi:hypothetical protein